MRVRFVLVTLLVLSLLHFIPSLSSAEVPVSDKELAMSETLDLWREGRYEQLYERLSHRGRMSKEQFVTRMRETTIRPACCWQKMQNFKILNEKRSEATVYVKLGMEGSSNASESVTREFKLSHDSGTWKMYLSDISNLAGVTAKKGKRAKRGKAIKAISP